MYKHIVEEQVAKRLRQILRKIYCFSCSLLLILALFVKMPFWYYKAINWVVCWPGIFWALATFLSVAVMFTGEGLHGLKMVLKFSVLFVVFFPFLNNALPDGGEQPYHFPLWVWKASDFLALLFFVYWGFIELFRPPRVAVGVTADSISSNAPECINHDALMGLLITTLRANQIRTYPLDALPINKKVKAGYLSVDVDVDFEENQNRPLVSLDLTFFEAYTSGRDSVVIYECADNSVAISPVVLWESKTEFSSDLIDLKHKIQSAFEEQMYTFVYSLVEAYRDRGIVRMSDI